MQQQIAPPIPGGRIADYRNSKPRFVRLYGLGDRGASLAHAIAREAGPNVAIKSGSQPVGWHEIAGEMPDPNTNMVVIVCGEGDQALFKADGNKPDSLVTFVVLQKVSNALDTHGREDQRHSVGDNPVEFIRKDFGEQRRRGVADTRPMAVEVQPSRLPAR